MYEWTHSVGKKRDIFFKWHVLIVLWSIDTFIYYTFMHNTVNSSSSLPFSADIRAIVRTIHCLELMKQPYNSAHINLGKRSHSHDTNIVKPIKNSEEIIVY